MSANTKIPLGKPSVGKEELDRIAKVIDSGCCAGTCEEVKVFEKNFAKYIGSKHAIATSSCTTALHIACKLLNVGPKTQVTVPTHTFPATANAAMYEGAGIHIVDVERDSYNMSVGHEMEWWGDVLMPVHSFGNPCDMPAIMDFAEDNNVKVIEDSACGVASTIKGKHTGTFAEIGCYSFYGIKELCTGEGGMLVTDNEEYAELARSLVDFGKTTGGTLPKFERLGFNYRLSAIQAAMGNVQLEKMPAMHKRRQTVANIYNRRIEEEFVTGTIAVQKVLPNAVHSYQRYTAILDKSIDRDKVVEQMAQEGIQTTIGTFDLSSIPMFELDESVNPVGRSLFKQSLSLPMYPDLTVHDANKVIDSLVCVIGRMTL